MLTGPSAPPRVKASTAGCPKCGSQIAWAIGRMCKGSATHWLKLPCHATWKRFPEVHKKMIANCPKCEANIF